MILDSTEYNGMLFALNCLIKRVSNNQDSGTTNKRMTEKNAERFFDRMESVKPVSTEEIARIKKSASKFVFVID